MSIADMLSFEMDSAKINSSISGSVSASDANAAPTSRANLDNLGRSVASGGAGWGNGNLVPEQLGNETTYDVREVPAGGYIVQNLPPGYQYKEHDTKRPNVNIPNFIEKDLDYIFTANFGISVGVVTQVLEGSYNASKAKIDLSWKRAIEYYLKQFESDFDREIYRSWVAAKVGTGDIIVFDWAKKRESWLGMRTITPTKPSLNPLVDARTSDIRTANGTSNHEYESQLYNGSSYSENIERLTSENETLKIARDKLETIE
jgi:capsid protein